MYRIEHPIYNAGEYGCVKLSSLYDEIEKRNKLALARAHEKFIAARKIQTAVRGWLVRRRRSNISKEALVIQKAYRGHRGWHRFYMILTDTYELQTLEYWNDAAIMIQSLWRGYWTRRHVHDHTKVVQSRYEAAKDLIICVAHKLHYLLRTKETPGIYSIKNSHCLSKVEKLLATLKFKEYNSKVQQLNEKQLKCIQSSIENSKLKENVKIPFGSYCNNLNFNEMHEMLDLYQKNAKKNAAGQKNDKRFRFSDTISRTQINLPNNQSNYQSNHQFNHQSKDVCVDVVESMTKWGIIKDEKNFIIPPSIAIRHDLIENFCNDITTIVSCRNIA